MSCHARSGYVMCHAMLDQGMSRVTPCWTRVCHVSRHAGSGYVMCHAMLDQGMSHVTPCWTRVCHVSLHLQKVDHGEMVVGFGINTVVYHRVTSYCPVPQGWGSPVDTGWYHTVVYHSGGVSYSHVPQGRGSPVDTGWYHTVVYHRWAACCRVPRGE